MLLLSSVIWCLPTMPYKLLFIFTIKIHISQNQNHNHTQKPFFKVNTNAEVIANEKNRFVFVALLFQCGLSCRLRLCTHSLTSTSASRGDATHKHIHKNPLQCLHTHAPTGLTMHTHTHTREPRYSEEIRAEGQGGVRSAFTANLLFLHLSSSAGIISYLQVMAFRSPLLCVF